MNTNLVESPGREEARPLDWLLGGGEMGKLIRSMDWAQTPLGPIALWPQSLRTTVSLCLASNFPIAVVWGPAHVQIYNDGYWPICGEKHPHAMGADFRKCWASAWPAIGGAFASALEGETSYLENQRMFLDRNGYFEEAFFTFSFSPIRDETGGIGGLFHPVTETTSQILSERRTRAVRDLTARAGNAQTVAEAFTIAAHTLSAHELDLPFLLFYGIDEGSKEAHLIASTGVPGGTLASPVSLSHEVAQRLTGPLAEVALSRQTLQIADARARLGNILCSSYPEPLKEALALPIIPPGCEGPVGIVVVGVSPRLPFNELYRGFIEAVAAGVTAAVANARARHESRDRLEAMAEIDRAKTAFFSNVSHEFRTPLTLMIGPLEDELAERHNPLPPARRQRLETAHRNTLRLLKLVNTLLDFARVESGRAEARYEPTDLATYTAELASVFRSACERAGLTLTVNCPSLPELVYVDRAMWEKVVLNLLSNAFKHTFDGGITVGMSWCASFVELTVADSGVGIAASELPRLLERFYRVKGAKSRTHEGTGIGLALVQELVGLHGGAIRVESKEGKGTTFVVTVKTGLAHLPTEHIGAERVLAPTMATAVTYAQEALHWLPDAVEAPDTSPSSPTADPADNRPTIVLADDNSDMREYVRRLLSVRYNVLAFPDGVAALAAALASPPDLVLTDVMMPGLDGFGLVRELRAHALTRTIPVIVLSARAGEESAIEGLDAGADDYLAKPFSAQELLARVRTHLELSSVRKNAEDALFAEKERAQVTLDSIGDAVICTDLAGCITFLNRVAEKMTGWLRQEAVGRSMTEVFKIAEGTSGKIIPNPMEMAVLNNRTMSLPSNCILTRRDGITTPIEDSVAPIHDRAGQATGAVIVFRDVSEVRAMALEMSHSATHDFLTGLPNRMFLNDRASQAIALASRHSKKVAIMFLDLDGFKHINDSLGHAIGDKLLQSIAKRLVTCVRGTDTVSRQGGDEFVVLLSEMEHSEDAAITATRMLEAVAEVHHIDHHDLHVTTSIGVSIFPDDGMNAETLTKNADTAMYQAKEHGRQSYQFFKAAMNVRAVERQSIEEGLRRGLACREFTLNYQPKVNLQTGEITGVEALIRWTHPTQGPMSPARFIPIAEDSGLIRSIGNWVLREACTQARAWAKAGLPRTVIAVNVSAIEFRHETFLEGVFSALEETDFDPNCLELELTESVLMKHVDATEAILTALRARGVRVAVDDFGTGYSSLSYLKKFSIDALKIDQSFIRQITADPKETTIVAAVIGMGRTLKLRIVAEGVETLEEMTFLQTHECDEAQGYYFSRPLRAEQLAQLLKAGIPDTIFPLCQRLAKSHLPVLF